MLGIISLFHARFGPNLKLPWNRMYFLKQAEDALVFVHQLCGSEPVLRHKPAGCHASQHRGFVCPGTLVPHIRVSCVIPNQSSFQAGNPTSLGVSPR